MSLSWSAVLGTGTGTAGSAVITRKVVLANVYVGRSPYDLVMISPAGGAQTHYEWAPKQSGGNRTTGPIYSPAIPGRFSTIEQAQQAAQQSIGSPMPTQQIQPNNTQAVAGGAMTMLNTISTQLNSPAMTAVTGAAAAVLPMTPWGALPAQGQQPLAVINPNQYQVPYVYARPFYKNTWLMAGVGLGLLAVGFTLFKFRPGRR